MARNFVQEGKSLALTAPYARTAGQAALIGALFVVALNDVENAAEGEWQPDGVWDLDKTAAQAWTLGDKIYWNAGTKLCSNVSADGQLVGVAVAAAANPSATGRVFLCSCAPDLKEGAQAAIADLVAIAGGEAPTEAEHNAVITAFNTLLAELRIVGIIAP